MSFLFIWKHLQGIVGLKKKADKEFDLCKKKSLKSYLHLNKPLLIIATAKQNRTEFSQFVALRCGKI